MYEKNKILAFIGARAGSKGLKNKNIIDFAGKPLIDWSIQASLQSQFIDRTIVSTDSQKIADIAIKSGADAPFQRPSVLAKDDSLIEDAIRHCIDWLQKEEHQQYDYLILLQPTSPLRTSQHIDEAIEYYFENRKTSEDTLVSVTEVEKKYGWLMQKDESGYIQFSFDFKKDQYNRQKLTPLFMPNGLIYIAPVEVYKDSHFYTENTLPFVMEKDISVDIDSQEDIEIALERFKHAAAKV